MSGLDLPATPNGRLTKHNRMTQEEEEEIVKELCNSNGLSYGRLPQEGSRVSSVEMFFSGYPKLIGLCHFPNLNSLTVIGQTVDRLEGLSTLTQLQELWICECEIKKIELLEGCKLLKKLYLYGNQIRQIENLDHLSQLEVLWLNTNRISNVENLGGLKELRELNLAENVIDKIGHNFVLNQNLEDLNLSGNKLYSFKDLTHLIKLAKLTSLSLKDPQYAPCPVSLLCNYSTHILYHLPNLKRLDTYDIDNQALHDLAASTVSKKKMFYNMRVKTTKRNFADVLKRVKSLRDQLLQFPHDRLKALVYAVKQIERELQETSVTLPDTDGYNSGTESDKDARETQVADSKTMELSLQSKHTALEERMKKWEKKAEEILSYYTNTLMRIQQSRDIEMSRLVAELESGGNIRFENGTRSDAWFSSCHDLILSRFCATDYKEHGISGIRIHRITRVHNRILRLRFEEKLSCVTDDQDGEFYPAISGVSTKKLLEYLFWVWDPEIAGGGTEPVRVLEEGFLDADTYKKLEREGAVPLSNSLSLADRHRIKSANKHSLEKEFPDNCAFRYGKVVVAKVYLGKSGQALDNVEIAKKTYKKLDSVYKARKKCIQSCTGTNAAGKPPCECSKRQCEWYIFDHELVVPEYVIEFEYVTRLKPKSPFNSVTDWVTPGAQVYKPSNQIDQMDMDGDVLEMEPKLKPRPRLITLSEELLQKIVKMDSILTVTVLNLHGNGITKLKYLHNLPQLKKLTLSFNEVTRLDDLAHSNIEHLDVSYNKIFTLEGVKGMIKLKYLDVSWNQLHNTREELSILRKHMPVLQTLDIRQNDWQKLEGLRLRTIGRLKSLTTLNGLPVTEEEATGALRVAASARISQVSLLMLSRTDTQPLRSLSLMSSAQCLSLISRHKPEKLADSDNSWYSKVTSLNLEGQHITKLSNLDRLEHLRWASFNDNDLTKIEGLEVCTKLEELSLENNCITKIENISKLQKLKKINLCHNYISTLDNCGIQNLPLLHYLDVGNNKLHSLAGLQRAISLVELYAGNNNITNIREIFYLKVLTEFVILDLWGNPVAKDVENYRLFVVYHLKSLKALDGSAVESIEGNQAKDAFGGRLSLDLIAERLGHANFHEIRELDFPTCGIRTVDLGNAEHFYNLRSVNLEHNNLTSFSGLRNLVNLRVLCLNHNHIECVVPLSKSSIPRTKASTQIVHRERESPENFGPMLENLEVLHLGYNGCKDMATLQLGRLTSLKALFLQGNEITKVEGIDGLHDLRELVLDRNKIKTISDTAFINQWNLQELHLEENRIRDLPNLASLENLQRLYLGSNRIQDIGELEKLEGLSNLIELSVVNNAIARRLLHRPMLVFRLPTLIVIDGIPVSDEERSKAELYFVEQQYPPPAQPVSDSTLPGISHYKSQVPVKVTNMQLGSTPSWGGPVYYDESVTETVHRVTGRKRAGPRGGESGSGSGNRMSNLGYQYSNPASNQPGSLYSNTGGMRPNHSYHGTQANTQANPTEYIETHVRYTGRGQQKR